MAVETAAEGAIHPLPIFAATKILCLLPDSRPSRPASRPAVKTPTPPARVQAPAPVGGGLASAVADGLAWGASTSIAHRAVDAIFGPRTIQVEQVESPAPAPAPAPMATTPDACGVQNKSFQDCLNYNGTDISKCQFYLDMLSECRKTSGGAALNV